jgi:aspartate carbamoyltransferase regulatory subunit
MKYKVYTMLSDGTRTLLIKVLERNIYTLTCNTTSFILNSPSSVINIIDRNIVVEHLKLHFVSGITELLPLLPQLHSMFPKRD